jgi:hypothetical protein
MGCGFSPTLVNVCNYVTEAPLRPLTSTSRYPVYENPNTLIVYHGSSCAKSAKSPGSDQQDFIRVAESIDLPKYVGNATVFLNGWHLQYLDGDHHVAGLTTLIRRINFAGATLTWQASGALSDDNFDDPYTWCYYYTVVAWNPANIDLVVDQYDGACERDHRGLTNFFFAENEGTSTALSSFPALLQDSEFPTNATVAVLPRGFGAQWGGGDDHHLLQIGYNLDHSEAIVKQGKYKNGYYDDIVPSPVPIPTPTPSGWTSQVDQGFVSWDTYGIFKDNDDRRDYSFGGIVSGLGGNDVGVIQPPFSILPIDWTSSWFGEVFGGSCSGGAPEPDVTTQDFAVENVPYEFAIPLLTGWELEYPPDCGDQHVLGIGIWIDRFNYEKPAGLPGTLRYTLSSVLHDDDNFPPHLENHKVTILGLRPVASKGTPRGLTPDLVPFSPLGTAATAFCRMSDDRKVLIVSVQNRGDADAGPSKTTVAFAEKAFTLATPAIVAGGSTVLSFKVPGGCVSRSCSFRITVDSSNQVNEGNGEGNNSVTGTCGS